MVAAWGPGRVNLIGEHTDYNGGLALPFAIGRGVTVRAEPLAGNRVLARALDLGENDEFELGDRRGSDGWRAFVRGVAAELPGVGARIEIEGDLPRGSGLSSSAALSTALCLAFLTLRDEEREPVELARLCSRVENEWVGARTGLLDQLAALLCREHHALRIDFESLELRHVPLRLSGWRLATLDSGASRVNAASGYNRRRDECSRACELLRVSSLRHADAGAANRLPDPLARRVRHVIEENGRVDAAVGALERADLPELGRLLDASHASLRDLYEVSTPEVERAVELTKDAGAAGARVVGGGFGGSVLGLFPPGTEPPAGAILAEPGRAAHLL